MQAPKNSKSEFNHKESLFPELKVIKSQTQLTVLPFWTPKVQEVSRPVKPKSVTHPGEYRTPNSIYIQFCIDTSPAWQTSEAFSSNLARDVRKYSKNVNAFVEG